MVTYKVDRLSRSLLDFAKLMGGGPMRPTYTSRNGKRYGYYVCRHTWKHSSGKSTTVGGLPTWRKRKCHEPADCSAGS